MLAIASFIFHYFGWQAARGFGTTCPKWRFPPTCVEQPRFRLARHSPSWPLAGANRLALSAGDGSDMPAPRRHVNECRLADLVETNGGRSNTVSSRPGDDPWSRRDPALMTANLIFSAAPISPTTSEVPIPTAARHMPTVVWNHLYRSFLV